MLVKRLASAGDYEYDQLSSSRNSFSSGVNQLDKISRLNRLMILSTAAAGWPGAVTVVLWRRSSAEEHQLPDLFDK